MRLYRLISRHGQLRKRMYPWFEPPPAGAPMKYDGWTWDPQAGEWVADDVALIDLEFSIAGHPKPHKPPQPFQPLDVVGWYWNGRAGIWQEVPMPTEIRWVSRPHPPEPTELPSRTQPAEVPGWRYSFMYEVWEKIPMEKIAKERPMVRKPMPKYPPGSAQASEVEGWSWSESQREWVATIVIAEKVGFTPPRSFSPQVTYAAVNMVYPMTEQYAHFYQSLLNQGLDPTEAKRIANMMVEGFWNMSRSALQKHRADLYAQSFRPAVIAGHDQLEAMTVYGVAIALAAIVGILIGDILDRLLTPLDESYALTARTNTYLLGPGGWTYSRNIGTSLEGRPYYSDCEGIGAEYSRHKRARWSGEYDIIDFPGGFVEEGYVFPYFVKYTWSHWKIRYVGMLFSVGANKYALKQGDYDAAARLPLGSTAPYEEWCEDFHWYL